MLKNFLSAPIPEKEERQVQLQQLRQKLITQQQLLKKNNLPVLVLLEGWGCAGKGSTVGKIIKNIDPRFYDVYAPQSKPNDNDRYPFLYKFFTKIPQAGKFAFLDSGWMQETVSDKLCGVLDNDEWDKRINDINIFERQLTDNGYLVLKLFLNIDKEEQKNRIDKLLASKDTKWRVSKNDIWQNNHYDKCLDVFDLYINATNPPNAPWYIIDAKDKKNAELQVIKQLTSSIETALQNSNISVPVLPNTFALKAMPMLCDVKLNKTISEDEYEAQLKKAQKKLGELHNKIYKNKIPVVIAYEGWDAAGKGGNIKRATDALDARGYRVHPIASPEPHEKARHYLWRFWTRLPKSGHIAVFDRTWYGRVMVERIEGFCSENDWQRAYNEINEFEQQLSDAGTVVIKFWLQIDKETQLERFTLRQNTPEKQWKITDEDWRNREKWDEYEIAVNEMLQKTSTVYAPWHIVESCDKRYARIKALNIIIQALEKALKEK